MLFLGQNGYRVIAHDRRSHGRKPNTPKPAPGHKIYPYLLCGITLSRHESGGTTIRTAGVGRKRNGGFKSEMTRRQPFSMPPARDSPSVLVGQQH